MFKIKAKEDNYTREIAGVHFVEGKAETVDENIARWLEGRGFEVEVIEDPKEPERKNISKMKEGELEAYAKELELDLSGRNNKEEKKAAIVEFLKAKETE